MPRETRGTTRGTARGTARETRGFPIPGALNGINKCTSRYIRKISIIITIIVSPQTTQPKVIFFKYREMSNQNTMAVFSKLFPKIILHFWLLILHCTEVQFDSFFSGGFITAITVNPPKRRLAKHTSVHCGMGLNTFHL